MEATLEEGGGGGPQGHIPRKKKPPEEKIVWVEVPNSPHSETRY